VAHPANATNNATLRERRLKITPPLKGIDRHRPPTAAHVRTEHFTLRTLVWFLTRVLTPY